MLIFQCDFHVFYYDEEFLVIMFATGLIKKLLSKVPILSIIFFDVIIVLNK